MIDLDFIEIGTSCYNTLIQQCSDKTTGISIEPIKYYLDLLPNKENVIKVNCAVSPTNKSSDAYIYHIKEQVIIDNHLPLFLRGCNSLNSYHLQHKKLGVQHLVSKQLVKQLPIGTILSDYSVRKISLLKIDTEGCDCDILFNLIVYLKDKNIDYYPAVILFESNEVANQDKVKKVIRLYKQLGYRLEYTGRDTKLVKTKELIK